MKALQTKLFYSLLCTSLFFALIGIQPAHAAATCYVNVNVSGGANDGSSWGQMPTPTCNPR